jgi:ankyrin repeat protein
MRRLIDMRDYSLKVLNQIAALGDIELFDHLVSHGADPQRSMALHRASKCPDPEKAIAMIDHLLDKHLLNIEANNADFLTAIDSPDAGTPLNLAVHYRNLATVKHLLKRGAQPRDAANQCAVMLGATPFLPALGPLLEAGADPDDALRVVIRTNDIEAARLCVEAGADPRAIISSQEARAARLAVRPELTSDNEEEYYDDEHPSDDESDAGWNDEMEAFLRSFDHSE